MSTKNAKDKLSEMTNMISGSMDPSATESQSKYEYSASYSASKEKRILGSWTVLDHAVDGVPYPEVFCAGTFRDIETENVHYEATYEFSTNICVKRVLVYGNLVVPDKQTSFDFRMSMALSWDLKGGTLNVRPVLGYQYTSLDGKPAAVKELPPTDSWIRLNFRFDEDFLTLEDGLDVKKLGRSAV
jgi:hypothetical protein